jgi:hypothetical protein
MRDKDRNRGWGGRWGAEGIYGGYREIIFFI